MLDWLSHQRRQLALEEAFLTSLERAQGAASASSERWEKRQVRAMARLGEAIADSMTADIRLRTLLRAAFEKAGVSGVQLTADQVKNVQQRVLSEGLPAEVVSALKRMGANEVDIAAFRARVLNAPAKRTARFPESLTDRSMMNALKRAAAAYRRYSRGAAAEPLQLID